MIGRLHAIGACLIGIFFLSRTYSAPLCIYIFLLFLFFYNCFCMYAFVCVCAWQDHLGLCPSYVTAPARLCAYFIHCFFLCIWIFFFGRWCTPTAKDHVLYIPFFYYFIWTSFFSCCLYTHSFRCRYFFSFFHLFCCCWAMPSNTWCINQSNGCCV